MLENAMGMNSSTRKFRFVSNNRSQIVPPYVDGISSLIRSNSSNHLQGETDNLRDVRPELYHGLTVIFFGVSEDAIQAAAMVNRAGANVKFCNYIPDHINAIDREIRKVDIVFVDADSLKDTGAVVEFCMKIRRLSHGVPIILLSSSVSSNDFTTERMSICDVTLKKPTARVVISYAIDAAIRNNARYQSLISDVADGMPLSSLAGQDV
jgi:hypothetical protein